MIPEAFVVKLLLSTIFKCWILSSIFHVKHLVADFFLQGKYMLGKFKEKGWALPLLAHVGVHGAITFAISAACIHSLPICAILALFDMTIHFIMDRIKVHPKLLGRFQALSKNEMYAIIGREKEIDKAISKFNDYGPAYAGIIQLYGQELADMNDKKKSNVYFWWSLGVDQFVHGMTHEFVVLAIMILSLAVR